MDVNSRIAALRNSMKKAGIDAYIIPSNDPHQSEYVAKHWTSRNWISGFSGSAGTAIITQNHAGIWTDSRYFLQAEEELASSEFVLHKQGIPHAPEHMDWLVNNLEKGQVLGCDGMLFSLGQIRYINSKLYGSGIELKTDADLIAEAWQDRPALPSAPVFEHALKFAGKSREKKMEEVRGLMEAEGADFYLVSTLDDIAWLLNIRGSDVDFNPVAVSYFVLSKGISYLFIDAGKVSEELKEALGQSQIMIKPYTEIQNFLEGRKADQKILIDTKSTSIGLFQLIPDDCVIKGSNLVLPLKAIKNETEVGFIREVMKKDGVALTRLYRWLEAELKERTIPETEVVKMLSKFRSEHAYYYGESFSAIVGYKGNGAIVHYRPQEDTCANIANDGMLLIDSGGQYQDGTTDITRTICTGEASEEQKKSYTLVLKGHIALAVAKFPRGTRGMQLDALARMYLWREGLNYGHGTGHGVGFFLNVHEPPQGFASSATTSRGTTSFTPGMFTSNEPGFYKTDEYGIRIENLVLCVEGPSNEFGDFLQFETLTLFPIATDLIQMELLDQAEKDWLNDYHEKVYKGLSPLLESEEQNWLKEKCKAI